MQKHEIKTQKKKDYIRINYKPQFYNSKKPPEFQWFFID